MILMWWALSIAMIGSVYWLTSEGTQSTMQTVSRIIIRIGAAIAVYTIGMAGFLPG